MPRILLLTLISALLVALASIGQAAEVAKEPVPEDAAQKQSAKIIADVYKSENAAAKTPEQKLDLAKKLFSVGLATKNDPTGKFVLIRIAKDLAAQQGD